MLSPETTTDDAFGAFFVGVELKFLDEQADPGVFSGYGAVFGNVDSHGDVIEPGAFSASLAEHKAARTMPGLYVEHQQIMGGGDGLPAGRWLDLQEDPHGLRVKGKISGLDTDYGKRLVGLMRDGALTGMSIAYTVRPGGAVLGKGPGEAKRTLKALDIHSIDIVRAPSNNAARIASVKTIGDVNNRAQFERWLRMNGWSRGQAAGLAANGWNSKSEADETAFANLAAKIDAAVLELKSMKQGTR